MKKQDWGPSGQGNKNIKLLKHQKNETRVSLANKRKTLSLSSIEKRQGPCGKGNKHIKLVSYRKNEAGGPVANEIKILSLLAIDKNKTRSSATKKIKM